MFELNAYLKDYFYGQHPNVLFSQRNNKAIHYQHNITIDFQYYCIQLQLATRYT